MGRSRGRDIFGIEDEGEEVARQAKLQRIAERIASYERGYEGNRRRCPQCGQYHTTSYPLDEELGLGEEQEQGRLREKLALVGVLVPYHQAP